MNESARALPTHLARVAGKTCLVTLQRQLAATATGQVMPRPYFTDLCAMFGASMIFDPNALSLTVEADDSVTDADRSVSLGLIVTELVINALKHAYPASAAGTDPKHGSIRVSYHTTGPGWTLSVSDDGVGMPGEDARGAPGLGTGIVKALARQLFASVTITSANHGTMVSITNLSA
jgi:two-component sensor histidine kinase